MSSSRGRDVAVGVADVLGLGEGDRALEDVQRGAGVATGERDEMLEGVVRERDATRRPEGAREPALRVGERAPDDRRRPRRRSAPRGARPASATGARR